MMDCSKCSFFMGPPTLSCIMIFTSKHPKCPTSIKTPKWLLIAFCFENSFHKLQYLREWRIFFAKASWDVANWYITRSCPHKLQCLIRWIQSILGVHILASKFLQIQVIRFCYIAFNWRQSKFYGQSLPPLLWPKLDKPITKLTTQFHNHTYTYAHNVNWTSIPKKQSIPKIQSLLEIQVYICKMRHSLCMLFM